jgi:hypothetical protein
MNRFTIQNFPIAAAFKFALRMWGIAIFCCSAILIIGGFPMGWWMVIPLLTVSVGSICFSIFVFAIRLLFAKTKKQSVFVNVLSVIIFFVMIWMSLVAAFSVTGFWD